MGVTCGVGVTCSVGVTYFSVVVGGNFLDDVKEWPGPFFDAHQLGVRLNFDASRLKKLSLETLSSKRCV